MASRSSRGASGARRTPGPDGENEHKAQETRMDKLKKERQDLNDENHDGFARHKETLEKEMMERQNKAERTKALRLNYIKFIYDAECKQIQDEFEGEQRQLRDAMLHDIQAKITQLESSHGTSMFGRSKRKFADEDELRQKIIRANEQLMNLDFVLPDDDIKADFETISKNLEKLRKQAKRQSVH